MKYHVHKAVVIGSGTMGAAIAAHLANAGIPVTLLDIVPQDAPPSGDLAAYLTSVAEIQQRTHLDFFRELDDTSEHQVEQQRANRVW